MFVNVSYLCIYLNENVSDSSKLAAAIADYTEYAYATYARYDYAKNMKLGCSPTEDSGYHIG